MDGEIFIQGTDVKHIKNVLRHKIGDELDVCDEFGVRYYTKIKALEESKIILQIMNQTEESTEMPVEVDLYQGLPKSDKLEFIIQKCTEIGVSSVIPVITDRVVVKLDDKSAAKKTERWNKIAIEAAKQSGRQKIPTVENVTFLENIVEKLSKYDIVIVPYECEKTSTLKAKLKRINKEVKSIAVVIGPEGGFSEKDIEILGKCPSAEKVSLGKRILRTETAGIATLAMILYEYEL